MTTNNDEKKICPRCGVSFICNHDDVSKCQCATIKLSAEQLEQLKQTYTDCLCINCLKILFK